MSSQPERVAVYGSTGHLVGLVDRAALILVADPSDAPAQVGKQDMRQMKERFSGHFNRSTVEVKASDMAACGADMTTTALAELARYWAARTQT